MIDLTKVIKLTRSRKIIWRKIKDTGNTFIAEAATNEVKLYFKMRGCGWYTNLNLDITSSDGSVIRYEARYKDNPWGQILWINGDKRLDELNGLLGSLYGSDEYV